MWLDSEEMSKWACRYCRYKDDKPEVRQFITNSFWAYYYCKFVKDDPGVRKHITKPSDAYFYCRYIKDRPEMRKLIKRSYFTNKPNIINKGGKNVVRS